MTVDASAVLRSAGAAVATTSIFSASAPTSILTSSVRVSPTRKITFSMTFVLKPVSVTVTV
jgi:secreted trypsin-like serine protease